MMDETERLLKEIQMTSEKDYRKVENMALRLAELQTEFHSSRRFGKLSKSPPSKEEP
jgi:hypothetical protein